jgi:hypothetical protein
MDLDDAIDDAMTTWELALRGIIVKGRTGRCLGCDRILIIGIHFDGELCRGCLEGLRLPK